MQTVFGLVEDEVRIRSLGFVGDSLRGVFDIYVARFRPMRVKPRHRVASTVLSHTFVAYKGAGKPTEAFTL